MENQLSNWKSMWQEQKSTIGESNEIIIKLKNAERSERLQRYKLFGITAVLVLALSICINEVLYNKYYLLSFLLLFVGIFIKLLPLYNLKFRNSDDLSYNTLEYIRNLSQKLEYNVWHLLTYMIIIISALNITIIGLAQKGSFFNYEINEANRFYFHLATVALFLVAFISNKRNLDLSRRRTKNLIQDIETHSSKSLPNDR